MRVKNNRLSFNFSPVTPAAYASGDAVGGLQSLAGAVRGSDQSGEIQGITVVDIDNQSAPLDLFLFQSAVTGGTDNVAYAPSDTEILECVGLIQVLGADYVTVGTRSVATVSLAAPFQLEQSTTLYIQVVSRGTPTYTAANSLRFNLVIDAD